eukprot:gnl/TRDRNA2_/TRDRNA2_154963_c0_seq2.p1 gnl/TRDRNA2_/TRDRNA2_154963_c0~~gnl/TRDRNA2_/TRDRNA2_154963_c0_seq2.p1  ORF type:complete len:362 (+),score=42.91 gnl/TRDRNA2_/TRDRNA2_154963_c0_seq2:2-1087(+)
MCTVLAAFASLIAAATASKPTKGPTDIYDEYAGVAFPSLLELLREHPSGFSKIRDALGVDASPAKFTTTPKPPRLRRPSRFHAEQAQAPAKKLLAALTWPVRWIAQRGASTLHSLEQRDTVSEIRLIGDQAAWAVMEAEQAMQMLEEGRGQRSFSHRRSILKRKIYRQFILASRPLRRLARAYVKALHELPLMTNAWTGATFCFVGDIVSQIFVFRYSHISWRRNAAMVTFGGCYDGGLGYYIAKGYVSMLPEQCKETHLRQGLVCSVIDNFLTTPLLYTPLWFLVTSALEGHPLKENFQMLRLGWLTSCFAGWIVWFPVQTLNFGFVPAHWRVVITCALKTCVLQRLCWVYVVPRVFRLP